MERVVLREAPVRRRHAFYRLTERGRRMLELNGLARRGLIDRRVEENRRLRRRKPVYALTERGAKAHEACRLIESL